MIRNVSFASFLVLCFFLAVVAAFHDVLSFIGRGNRERGDNICKVFCAFFLPAFAGMASLFGGRFLVLFGARRSKLKTSFLFLLLPWWWTFRVVCFRFK